MDWTWSSGGKNGFNFCDNLLVERRYSCNLKVMACIFGFLGIPEGKELEECPFHTLHPLLLALGTGTSCRKRLI